MQLGTLLEATRPLLAKHGLVVIQKSFTADNAGGVETVIYHTSGQFIDCGVLHMPTKDMTAQGVGGALTYARRYAYMSALNLFPDKDDDGNVATGNTATVTQRLQHLHPHPPPRKPPLALCPSCRVSLAIRPCCRDSRTEAVKAVNSGDGRDALRCQPTPGQLLPAARIRIGIIDYDTQGRRVRVQWTNRMNWDGNEVKAHDVALFSLFGRTWERCCLAVSRWIFDNLSKRRRSVTTRVTSPRTPDGKAVQVDNPNYNKDFVSGVAFLTAYVIQQLSADRERVSVLNHTLCRSRQTSLPRRVRKSQWRRQGVPSVARLSSLAPVPAGSAAKRVVKLDKIYVRKFTAHSHGGRQEKQYG